MQDNPFTAGDAPRFIWSDQAAGWIAIVMAHVNDRAGSLVVKLSAFIIMRKHKVLGFGQTCLHFIAHAESSRNQATPCGA